MVCEPDGRLRDDVHSSCAERLDSVVLCFEYLSAILHAQVPARAQLIRETATEKDCKRIYLLGVIGGRLNTALWRKIQNPPPSSRKGLYRLNGIVRT